MQLDLPRSQPYTNRPSVVGQSAHRVHRAGEGLPGVLLLLLHLNARSESEMRFDLLSTPCPILFMLVCLADECSHFGTPLSLLMSYAADLFPGIRFHSQSAS